jgi:hypothetical protein
VTIEDINHDGPREEAGSFFVQDEQSIYRFDRGAAREIQEVEGTIAGCPKTGKEYVGHQPRHVLKSQASGKNGQRSCDAAIYRPRPGSKILRSKLEKICVNRAQNTPARRKDAFAEH